MCRSAIGWYFLTEKEKKILLKKSKYIFSKDSSLSYTIAGALRLALGDQVHKN